MNIILLTNKLKLYHYILFMLGIIGGTGFESLLKDTEKKKISTPYGPPSDLITIGTISGRKVAFLPRHGSAHTIPPHKINYHANIHALAELGCTRIIGLCAVGSLNEYYEPGDIVIPDQFIDFSSDVTTFYNGAEVYHISLADPFCPELRNILIKTADSIGARVHPKATYLRISGPQFSTRAASRMYRNFAHIIGMTGVPEAILCREKQICFSILATITDYDVWAENPVSLEQVKRIAKQNSEKTRKIIESAIPEIPLTRNCACKNVLEDAKF